VRRLRPRHIHAVGCAAVPVRRRGTPVPLSALPQLTVSTTGSITPRRTTCMRQMRMGRFVNPSAVAVALHVMTRVASAGWWR
jgi:hypothetical protein